ncbi:MAG: 4Fe-4S dicluster domain-containing protein [Candidatus Bathyarchaeota archaeon]|jgi:ferredoxin|nr:4Fe-4S dicluster domain-containing protein [Candidatus Bathyarchaeota archaeon]
MEKLVLPKLGIRKLIIGMLAEHRFFGPVDDDGATLFKQIKDPAELDLTFTNSTVPPKALLFKQTETLFKFSLGRSVKIDPVDITNERTIIFGIRPCDAKSLAILDQVFKGDYEDPFYLTRRKNTVLIGLSCTQPGVNCFCTSFKDGPASSENVDVLLTDIGEKYYVEVRSDKGKHLIASMKELLRSAKAEDENNVTYVEEKAIAAITRNMNIEGMVNKLDKMFENSLWKTIAMKCLGCGVCTYLCPTCNCFDIQDETALEKGARVRVWDSCMYPEYTLQASGHNPRPERVNRIRNRVYHKFNYCPKNYGVTACVGCGRCIDNCPVNIDIIDVINKAGEAKV